MRIISKYKDYYDNLQGTDTEKDVLFVRTETVWTTEDFKTQFPDQWNLIDRPSVMSLRGSYRLPRTTYYDFTNAPQCVRPIEVYFCGTCYSGIVFDAGWWPITGNYVGRKREVFYTFESLMDFVGSPRLAQLLELPRAEIEAIRTWFSMTYVERELKEFLQPKKQKEELFRKLQAPVFLIVNKTLIVNPDLSKWSFARHIHPYRAYQEIEQYLTGPMLEHKETGWTGSDRVRAEQRGFDNKSFKTESPGKKFFRWLGRKKK